MDLATQIRELLSSVKEALSDGRINAAEAIKIVKELLDVILVLLEFTGAAVYTATREDKKECSDGLW